MGQPKPKEDWKLIKFWLNSWVYKNRVEQYAKDLGISVSDVMRLAINEFFKDKPTL